MAALAQVDVVESTVPVALTTTTPPESCIALRPKFEQDGFVILEGVLPAATIRLLNERLEAVLRGIYDTGRKPDKTPRFKVEERCKPGKPASWEKGSEQHFSVLRAALENRREH